MDQRNRYRMECENLKRHFSTLPKTQTYVGERQVLFPLGRDQRKLRLSKYRGYSEQDDQGN